MSRHLRRVRVSCLFLRHRLARKFKSKGKLNEENEDICPICMDVLSVRPADFFVCKNHKAHLDCLEEYNFVKTNNNLPLDCPFRDAPS